MSRAVLSLGSNIGDRTGHLQTAVAALGRAVRAVSSIYRTPPWGGVEQDDFYNIVVIAEDDQVTVAHGWWATMPGAGAGGRPGAAGALGPAHPGRRRHHRRGARAPGRQRRSRADPAASAGGRAGIRAGAVGGVDPTAELPGAGPIADLLERLDTTRHHQGRACALNRDADRGDGAVADDEPDGLHQAARPARRRASSPPCWATCVVRLSYQRMPPLPRFAGLAAALVGIGEAVAGFGLRSRIRPPRTRTAPGVATRKAGAAADRGPRRDGGQGDVAGRRRRCRAVGRAAALRAAVLVGARRRPGRTASPGSSAWSGR